MSIEEIANALKGIKPRVEVREADKEFWIHLNGIAIAYITKSGKTVHVSEAWCRVARVSRLEVSHNHKKQYVNWRVQKTFHD